MPGTSESSTQNEPIEKLYDPSHWRVLTPPMPDEHPLYESPESRRLQIEEMIRRENLLFPEAQMSRILETADRQFKVVMFSSGYAIFDPDYRIRETRVNGKIVQASYDTQGRITYYAVFFPKKRGTGHRTIAYRTYTYGVYGGYIQFDRKMDLRLDNPLMRSRRASHRGQTESIPA